MRIFLEYTLNIAQSNILIFSFFNKLNKNYHQLQKETTVNNAVDNMKTVRTLTIQGMNVMFFDALVLVFITTAFFG